MGSLTYGQVNLEPPNGMASPVDFYGNAQAMYPERRQLNIFLNEAQKQALSAYQPYNQPVGQRGYGTSFALPSDQFMKTMLGRQRPGFSLSGAWQQRPSTLGLYERERKTAFNSYGGFGQRRSPYAPGDAEGLFTRKKSLITATSSTAPIERSKLNRGGLGTIRFPVAQTPFQVQQPASPEGAEPLGSASANRDSLSRFLTSESQVLHDRARSEGWKQFEAGDYRAAVRSFESASMLDEKDAEARIATVFSYVSLGSFLAAYATLNNARGRDENIFSHDISMSEKYGNSNMVQQVRLTAQSMAEASEQSAEIKALAIYLLWYMDSKEDALRAVKSLTGKDVNHTFADWPGLMQAALTGSPAKSP